MRICTNPTIAADFRCLSSWLCYLAGFLILVLCQQSHAADKSDIKTVGLLVGAGGLGDQSYNDMTFSGLGKAQKEFGFHLIVEETVGSNSSREASIEKLLQDNADIIVANGTGLIELVKTYSARYPKIIFLINDCRLEGFNNVASTMFAHQEGSYLVGMLAASISTTGKIGFIGGVDIPIIKQFLNGYKNGARNVAPQTQVEARFISKESDYSGFENPEKGFATAVQMYDDGVDIIYSVAGLTGNGIIQAASKLDKLVIGVDADQDHMAKGNVLTSMMKRLDRATYLEMAKILKGEFKPGVTHYDLSNGGISLTPMKYTRPLVPDAVLTRIKQAEKDIIDGKISYQ